MKIYDLLRELQSFISIPTLVIETAEKSSKKVPKDLLRDWTSGAYDESPELLAQELISLI